MFNTFKFRKFICTLLLLATFVVALIPMTVVKAQIPMPKGPEDILREVARLLSGWGSLTVWCYPDQETLEEYGDIFSITIRFASDATSTRQAVANLGFIHVTGIGADTLWDIDFTTPAGGKSPCPPPETITTIMTEAGFIALADGQFKPNLKLSPQPIAPTSIPVIVASLIVTTILVLCFVFFMKQRRRGLLQES